MLKININKMQTRLKRWDIKVSHASHRSTEKEILLLIDNDKLNGQNQIQRHRQIKKKLHQNWNKGRATNNNYSDILKSFG